MQVNRHVHDTAAGLRRRRDVRVCTRYVPGDGLAEALAVEVDVVLRVPSPTPISRCRQCWV